MSAFFWFFSSRSPCHGYASIASLVEEKGSLFPAWAERRGAPVQEPAAARASGGPLFAGGGYADLELQRHPFGQQLEPQLELDRSQPPPNKSRNPHILLRLPFLGFEQRPSI